MRSVGDLPGIETGFMVFSVLRRCVRWLPLWIAALAALTVGCASLGRVAEPTFTTDLRDGDFEVRSYGPRVVAETTVRSEWNDAGTEGFRRLAHYIFGGNRGRAKIAMTAPVGQAPEKGESIAMTAPVGQRARGQDWVVTFTMPAGETLDSLPAPEDPRVVLRVLPPSKVAVVRFSGRWTDANFREHEAALRAWTQARGLEVAGDAEVNRFDPPFKPWFLRRNEIWLALAAPTASAPAAR
jgi:hypothetical protein